MLFEALPVGEDQVESPSRPSDREAVVNLHAVGSVGPFGDLTQPLAPVLFGQVSDIRRSVMSRQLPWDDDRVDPDGVPIHRLTEISAPSSQYREGPDEEYSPDKQTGVKDYLRRCLHQISF